MTKVFYDDMYLLFHTYIYIEILSCFRRNTNSYKRSYISYLSFQLFQLLICEEKHLKKKFKKKRFRIRKRKRNSKHPINCSTHFKPLNLRPCKFYNRCSYFSFKSLINLFIFICTLIVLVGIRFQFHSFTKMIRCFFFFLKVVYFKLLI